VIEKCSKEEKEKKKSRNWFSFFIIQSEDLDMIDVSKKVYTCAYLSIDKTDE
jgi:hypothetical protein